VVTTGDCDDNDDQRNPSLDETFYDGFDSNCDPSDEYDQDGDGADITTAPQGGADCDDLDPDIGPDAVEICDNGMDDNCDGGAPACRWLDNPWTDLRYVDLNIQNQRPDDIQLTPIGEDGAPPQDLVFRLGNRVGGLEGPTFERVTPGPIYAYMLTLPELSGDEALYGYHLTTTSRSEQQRITVWNYQTINSGNSGSRYRTFTFDDGQAHLTEADALFDVTIDASAIFIDPPFPPVPPVFHGATPRRTSWMSACDYQSATYPALSHLNTRMVEDPALAMRVVETAPELQAIWSTDVGRKWRAVWEAERTTSEGIRAVLAHHPNGTDAYATIPRGLSFATPDAISTGGIGDLELDHGT
jgi:hypothetical protein